MSDEQNNELRNEETTSEQTEKAIDENLAVSQEVVPEKNEKEDLEKDSSEDVKIEDEEQKSDETQEDLPDSIRKKIGMQSKEIKRLKKIVNDTNDYANQLYETTQQEATLPKQLTDPINGTVYHYGTAEYNELFQQLTGGNKPVQVAQPSAPSYNQSSQVPITPVTAEERINREKFREQLDVGNKQYDDFRHVLDTVRGGTPLMGEVAVELSDHGLEALYSLAKINPMEIDRIGRLSQLKQTFEVKKIVSMYGNVRNKKAQTSKAPATTGTFNTSNAAIPRAYGNMTEQEKKDFALG